MAPPVTKTLLLLLFLLPLFNAGANSVTSNSDAKREGQGVNVQAAGSVRGPAATKH